MLLTGRKRFSDERGVEIVEFVGIFPLILMMGLLIWQVLLFGHTMLDTVSAAREGARAAAAHRSCQGAAYLTLGKKAFLLYFPPTVDCGGCGGYGSPVEATVKLRLPTVHIPWVGKIGWVFTETKAVFRCEPDW